MGRGHAHRSPLQPQPGAPGSRIPHTTGPQSCVRTYPGLVPASIFPKADPATDVNVTHAEEDQRVALCGWARSLDVCAGAHVVRMRPRGLCREGSRLLPRAEATPPPSPPMSKSGIPKSPGNLNQSTAFQIVIKAGQSMRQSRTCIYSLTLCTLLCTFQISEYVVREPPRTHLT